MLTRSEMKNITFGAELEYAISDNVGSYIREFDTLPPLKRDGEIELNCQIKSDSSIESNNFSENLELNIDYGSYHQLLRRAKIILKCINSLPEDYEVNKTTGLHYHIGAKGIPATTLKSIYHGWSSWAEDYFLAISPPSRRNNRYCASVKLLNFTQWLGGVDHDTAKELQTTTDRHYYSLNPQFYYDNNATIEIRLFQSTTQLSKFKAYLKLIYLFLQAEGKYEDFLQLLSENKSLLKWITDRQVKFAKGQERIDAIRNKLEE